MTKYRVFSGPTTGKYGPEKNPCLDTFDPVQRSLNQGKSLLIFASKTLIWNKMVWVTFVKFAETSGAGGTWVKENFLHKHWPILFFHSIYRCSKLDSHLPKKLFLFASIKVVSLFVLEIYAFLSWFFGYIEKRLDKKAKVNFKFWCHLLNSK